MEKAWELAAVMLNPNSPLIPANAGISLSPRPSTCLRRCERVVGGVEKAWELAVLIFTTTPHIRASLASILRASQRKLGTSIPVRGNKYLGNVVETLGTLGSCCRRNERGVGVWKKHGNLPL